MPDLDWKQTPWGYESVGYRIVNDDIGDGGSWRLEPVGSAGAHGADHRVTRHRTFEEAADYADQTEREHLRRLTAAGHFLVSGVALALFVVFSQYIGTLSGLAMVAAAFYVTLRAAGNGLGAVLQEAWGWTRPRRQSETLMERMVRGVVERIRDRQLAASRPPVFSRVRALAPRR